MNADVNTNSTESIFLRPKVGIVRYLNFEPVVVSSDDCYTVFANPFKKPIETSTVFSTDLIIQELVEFGFSLNNGEETAEFIVKNQNLKKVLSETKTEVSKYFPDFELELTYYKDEEEDSENLGIGVLHSLELDQALERESELFDNWFEKHYVENQTKITLREYYRG